MNYIDEAARLTAAGFPPALSAPLYAGGSVREDGLCVDGCDSCRAFRNSVRDAQVAEQADIAAKAQAVADFDREELHCIEGCEEAIDHLKLLPLTDAVEAAAAAVYAARLAARNAWREARAAGTVLTPPNDDAALFAAIFGGASPFAFEDEGDDLPEFPY